MSHGPVGEGGVSAEPNLTPLLDLVLQLVMFFMISAKFVMEDVNETIKLPPAQTAEAIEPNPGGTIFLNVTSDGQILVSGKDPFQTLGQLKTFLVTEKQDFERLPEARKKLGMPLVVLRADKNSTYKQVYDVLNTCQTVGFNRLEMRAKIQRGEG